MTNSQTSELGLHAHTTFTKIDETGNILPLKLNELTGELTLKNPHFFQFYKKTFPLIMDLMAKNALAGRIFMFMVNEMNQNNALIISYVALSEIFQKSRRTISRAIKTLADGKYIQIQKSGNMNIYCINAALVWTQSRKKINYAKFNAAVYITATEQTVETKKESIPLVEPKSKRPTR